MSKKVLVITSSLRANSNSDALADSFADGAKSSGNTVEVISLKDKSISFCRGCMACQKTQKCVIRDDAIEIAEKIKNSDVAVFATPVYYYELAGQLKTLLDRCNPIFSSNYAFRDVYLLQPPQMKMRAPWGDPSKVWRAGSPALRKPVWPEQSLPGAWMAQVRFTGIRPSRQPMKWARQFDDGSGVPL